MAKVPRSILDDLVDQEPELHHYTTHEGLKGIVETNTLWATHFRATNDSTELSLFHELLFKEVCRRLEPIFSRLAANDRQFLHSANKISGSLDQHLNDHALGLVDTLYDHDIGDPLRDFSKSLDDSAFVTCFCAHNKDDDYIRKHGLLSQWRAYTAATKYCVVFDTAQLVDLTRREVDHHFFRYMTVDRAVYVDDEYPATDEYQDIAEFATSFVESAVSGKKVECTVRSRMFEKVGLFDTFLGCATRLKHLGFAEERELRIVAVRGGPEWVSKIRAAGAELEFRQPKSLRSRQREGRTIPYIALFDELHAALPIKRVIVGPSGHQQRDYELARKLVSSSIPIDLSRIPFVD